MTGDPTMTPKPTPTAPPDALVEKVAEAINAARYRHPEHPREPLPLAEEDRSSREYAYRLARAAISAIPAGAEGFVLVPVEPTNKMLLRCQTKQAAAGYSADEAEWLTDIYRAMLAAAPVPPASDEGDALNEALKAVGEFVEPYQAPRESGAPLECDMSQEDADHINRESRERLRKAITAYSRAAQIVPPASDEGLVKALEEAGQFLLDRLSELEFTDDAPERLMRDWFGHVEPAIERFRAALSTRAGGRAEPDAVSEETEAGPKRFMDSIDAGREAERWICKQADALPRGPFIELRCHPLTDNTGARTLWNNRKLVAAAMWFRDDANWTVLVKWPAVSEEKP